MIPSHLMFKIFVASKTSRRGHRYQKEHAAQPDASYKVKEDEMRAHVTPSSWLVA